MTHFECMHITLKTMAAIALSMTAQAVRLPLTFEANRGQHGADVKFVVRGGGYEVLLTAHAAVRKSGGSACALSCSAAIPIRWWKGCSPWRARAITSPAPIPRSGAA